MVRRGIMETLEKQAKTIQGGVQMKAIVVTDEAAAWTFLIGANLFWAGNIIFGKLIVGELPAEWTVFLRWVVGLILLIPIAQFIEKPSWDQIWRNNWVLIILLATLSIVL